MRYLRPLFALAIGLALAVSQANGQTVERKTVFPTDPNCPPRPPIYYTPITPMDPAKTDKMPDPKGVPPMDDAFAERPPAGTTGGAYQPPMFGDIFGGPFIRTRVTTPHGSVVVGIPQVSRGGFKIADNEYVCPVDRVFITYNYYNNADVIGGPRFDLHREMVGFEKTFCDGNASFGMRIPFLQLDIPDSTGGIPTSQFGDLSFIFKWAFLHDHDCGNCCSAGMVVTVPTGDDFQDVNGRTIHPTILQPYLGGYCSEGDFYVHAFTSLGIPTDSRDITFWSNDVGIGYWIYRNANSDSLCRGVAPTLEGHLFTPLNHNNPNGEVFAPDYFELTAGVNILMGGNCSLGIAAGVPLTGPRPYDFQAIMSFNLRF
jgi:hypothetical protein